MGHLCIVGAGRSGLAADALLTKRISILLMVAPRILAWELTVLVI
jgi:predicted NAD/FAD-binding protein